MACPRETPQPGLEGNAARPKVAEFKVFGPPAAGGRRQADRGALIDPGGIGSFNNQQSWQESDAPTGLCITAQGWPRNEAYPGIHVREIPYPNGVVSGG